MNAQGLGFRACMLFLAVAENDLFGENCIEQGVLDLLVPVDARSSRRTF